MISGDRNQPNPDAAIPELLELLQRGVAGDATALPKIKQAFDSDPRLTALFGDLVRHAEEELLALLAGQDLVARESIARQIAELRTRLMAKSHSAVEKVLVDRLVMSWLGVYEAEIDLARQRKRNPGASPVVAAAVKRLDRAQARHLAAAKALAVVQKLLKPAPSVLDLLGRPAPDSDARGAAGRRPTTRRPTGVSVVN